ncbi:hypothetical protein [Rhodococcus opacus]|nr:hypothetical protein [Rhodococcus opacus]
MENGPRRADDDLAEHSPSAKLLECVQYDHATPRVMARTSTLG